MTGLKRTALEPASAARATLLTLVRHGETSANVEGVWHGSTDTRLTDRGRTQARAVASFLIDREPVAAVYASPLRRALDTARAIAEAFCLPVRTDPDLAEFDLGYWEGKTFLELEQEMRLWSRMRLDPDFTAPGGESPRRVATRMTGALRRISNAHPQERVVVVSHGGALSLAIEILIDGTCGEWRRVMANCAVSELVLDPEPELLAFNAIGHLEGI